MENRIILFENYHYENHPNIKGIQIVEGKNNFPISWLNQQGYCEYQLYLQYMKGIETYATKAMNQGSAIHNQLEEEFKKTAKEASFDEAVDLSQKEAIISRECFVISPKSGIRGFIDEIWMKPDEIVIIDDKPGSTPYSSTINQVRAYCLAFKEFTNDKRIIKGALRQRGTDNIFWSEEFGSKEENEIQFVIDRMHGLFEGSKPFIATKNPNKCKSCRYQSYCKHYK